MNNNLTRSEAQYVIRILNRDRIAVKSSLAMHLKGSELHKLYSARLKTCVSSISKIAASQNNPDCLKCNDTNYIDLNGHFTTCNH